MIRCDSSNARIRRACNEVPIAVDLVLLNNPVAHRSVPQLNCSGPCVDDDGFVAVYGPPLRDVVAKEATLIAADRVRGRAFERLRSHSRHAVTAIAMETKPNVLQVIFSSSAPALQARMASNRRAQRVEPRRGEFDCRMMLFTSDLDPTIIAYAAQHQFTGWKWEGGRRPSNRRG